jgi:hypothetical protein
MAVHFSSNCQFVSRDHTNGTRAAYVGINLHRPNIRLLLINSLPLLNPCPFRPSFLDLELCLLGSLRNHIRYTLRQRITREPDP